MKIFVIIFALFAIILFFALALKRGSQNRSEIMEIEKAEGTLLPEASEAESGEKQSVLMGSVNNIKNTAAKTMKWLGLIILIGGTLISFCSASTNPEGIITLQYGFSFLLFFTCELITCAAGFFFIALGEIIRLLDEISRSLKVSGQ